MKRDEIRTRVKHEYSVQRSLALYETLSNMTKSKRKKRTSDEQKETMLRLTSAAVSVPPSERCWKCKGTGFKFSKENQCYDGPPCKVCDGEGIRKRSKRSKVLATQKGKILNLRGYPQDHHLRTIFPEGFAGPCAFWGKARKRNETSSKGEIENGDKSDNLLHNYDDLPEHLRPREGEIVGSLGCGDWRIYQIADGNKLTVDDFVCAWVAADEMRKRGYGTELHKGNTALASCDGSNQKMFGGRTNCSKEDSLNESASEENSTHRFKHADIGTGCGSVLMMTAWAFLGEIRSIGVEAQSISYSCLKRGLEWNLGSDGTNLKDIVQIRQNDLRTWDGCGLNSQEIAGATDAESEQSPCLAPPYHLITGTPPYFPLDSFVASQNHEQKVRCRVPTRGGAKDYIDVASRYLMEEKSTVENSGKYSSENKAEGVFCMVEAAFDKAEAGVLAAVKRSNMRVRRRVDVVTRSGLPPRFSCWVMTKKSTTSQKTAENDNAGEKNNSDDTFPIEILTLRNADFSRTKEYTKAMEIMGWVDFEKSKLKVDKSLKEIDGPKIENN